MPFAAHIETNTNQNGSACMVVSIHAFGALDHPMFSGSQSIHPVL
jgi:hypothetical protein